LRSSPAKSGQVRLASLKEILPDIEDLVVDNPDEVEVTEIPGRRANVLWPAMSGGRAVDRFARAAWAYHLVGRIFFPVCFDNLAPHLFCQQMQFR
jgi:hypothetical protein